MKRLFFFLTIFYISSFQIVAAPFNFEGRVISTDKLLFPFGLNQWIRNIHKFPREEIEKKIHSLKASRKRKLLLFCAIYGKEELLSILSNNLEINQVDIRVITNTALRHRKYNILPQLADMYPSIVFEIILDSSKIRKYEIIQVVKGVDQVKLTELPSESLEKLAEIMGFLGEKTLLFQLGSFAPLIAFKEIIPMRDLEEISRFISENLKNFSLKDKKEIYKLILEFYYDDSLEEGLMTGLKSGLSAQDLEELEEFKKETLESQCHICMTNIKECFFSCKGAKKYGHGACSDCYFNVMRLKDPKCPWCRTPMKANYSFIW